MLFKTIFKYVAKVLTLNIIIFLFYAVLVNYNYGKQENRN